MRASLYLVAAILAAAAPATAETTVSVGVGSPSLQFDFLYTDYGVQPVVVERQAALLGESDLLVALHICRVTGVELEVVIDWRRSGMSWDGVTRRCQRDASIYWVELPSDVTGPPYGRAYGYWKKHPKGDLQLSDTEIRELVLVRSIASHTGMPARDVVRRRAHGDSPRVIAGRPSGRDTEDAAPPAPGAKQGRGGHGKGGKKK